MLKKISVLLFAFAAASISTSSMAWSLFEINGEKLEINGKMVRVFSKDSTGEHIFSSKDVANGLYVVAVDSSAKTNILPMSTKVIRDFLSAKGIKIVETPDAASLGIKFVVSGLNVDESNVLPGQVDYKGNAMERVAGAAVVNNVAGSLAGSMALFANSTGHIVGTPLKLSGLVIQSDAQGAGGESPDVVTGYSGDKGDDLNASIEDLLKVMTNFWLKKFYVEDKS